MNRLYSLIAALIMIAPPSVSAQKRIDALRADYDSLGNTSGAFLFPKEKGANLRILDMNIWEWDGTREKLPQAWVEAGEDCTNEVRSKGFAGIVAAYMPDVVCLQEYSPEMHLELYPRLAAKGYEITFVPGPDEVNYTPVFYRNSKVKLIETAY